MSDLAGAGGPTGEAVGSGGVLVTDCRLRHGNQPDHLAWHMERRRRRSFKVILFSVLVCIVSVYDYVFILGFLGDFLWGVLLCKFVVVIFSLPEYLFAPGTVSKHYFMLNFYGPYVKFHSSIHSNLSIKTN